MNGLTQSGSSTAIYNAINSANNEFISNPRLDSSKIMIVLTDGYDNASTVTANSVIQTAMTNDIVIYTIGIGTYNSPPLNDGDIDTVVLTNIAESTGGIFYHTTDFSQLESLFNRLRIDVDLYKDSDGDGLSDYHEKKIAAGLLRLGSLARFKNFSSLNYMNPDSDGDGLKDGEELQIRSQFINGQPVYYCYMYSNPCLADSDGDGLLDFEDPEPLVKNNYIVRDINNKCVGVADKFYQAVGIVNKHGNIQGDYIKTKEGNIVYTKDNNLYGYNGATFSTTFSADPDPWCESGNNRHIIGTDGIFYAHTVLLTDKFYNKNNVLSHETAEANIGTMAYVYKERLKGYNKITATFDLAGTKFKDVDDLDKSGFGFNKFLYVQRNGGNSLMEAGFRMTWRSAWYDEAPYFCAYVNVNGENLYKYYEALNDNAFKLFGKRNAKTGEITFDENPQLGATILISDVGDVTLIHHINGIDKEKKLIEINSKIAGDVKTNWANAIGDQQADYCYCVSDCWAPYKPGTDEIGSNIKQYCYDLESGSYIRNIKITEAKVLDTYGGKEAVSFLTTTDNHSKAKFQPSPQVRHLATSTYDAFSLVATIDGL